MLSSGKKQKNETTVSTYHVSWCWRLLIESFTDEYAMLEEHLNLPEDSTAAFDAVEDSFALGDILDGNVAMPISHAGEEFHEILERDLKAERT